MFSLKRKKLVDIDAGRLQLMEGNHYWPSIKRVVIKDYRKPCLFAMQISQEQKVQGLRHRAQGPKEGVGNQYPEDYKYHSITPGS
ncbi:MAG: hypothetical protein LJE87_04920 [Deltaproteobacteria bacterium]|nr:hypothetical protein [Deltaproteobacteria bacterium]